MSNKIQNAEALYLEGIRDGHYEEAVHKYTGDQYVQHSTGVKTGKEGFIEFFSDFVQRCPVRDIEIIRKWEDGQYVFVQAFQNINNGESQWITTDFFDTDDQDRMIEHWDVISAYSGKSVSGHDQIDGTTEIKDLHLTEQNKEIVKAFIQDVLSPSGDLGKMSDYVSDQDLIQHHLEIEDGINSYEEFFKNDVTALVYDEIVLCVGSGNFVATLCKTHQGNQEIAQVDIFRLEDGLIVEHWDNAEPVPEVQVNSGKF